VGLSQAAVHLKTLVKEAPPMKVPAQVEVMAVPEEVAVAIVDAIPK